VEKLNYLVLILEAAQDCKPLAEVNQALQHLQGTAAKQCSNASLVLGYCKIYAEEVMKAVNSIMMPSRGPQALRLEDINMIPDCCVLIVEQCDQTMEGMEQLQQEILSAVHCILNALKDGTFSS
jgi:hypothetical protein